MDGRKLLSTTLSTRSRYVPPTISAAVCHFDNLDAKLSHEPTTRAGLPATTEPETTEPVTTDPAPITQLSPIRTPGRMMAPAPTNTSDPILTRANLKRRPFSSRTNQPEPSCVTICTFELIVTRSPMLTSQGSLVTTSERILQPLPMDTPAALAVFSLPRTTTEIRPDTPRLNLFRFMRSLSPRRGIRATTVAVSSTQCTSNQVDCQSPQAEPAAYAALKRATIPEYRCQVAQPADLLQHQTR